GSPGGSGGHHHLAAGCRRTSTVWPVSHRRGTERARPYAPVLARWAVEKLSPRKRASSPAKHGPQPCHGPRAREQRQHEHPPTRDTPGARRHRFELHLFELHLDVHAVVTKVVVIVEVTRLAVCGLDLIAVAKRRRVLSGGAAGAAGRDP